MKLGLSVPNFAEPGVLVGLGVDAERSGWDGVFLWDHIHGSPAFPVPTADPWVVLGALAVRTERIRLGTTITAPARRHPRKLARETVTVDRLSGGRLVLGVGLGEPPEEYTAYGEPADRPTLAEKLDEALDVITGLWTGQPFEYHGHHYTVEGAQFLPPPLQSPRIPIWASCVAPHRRPLARAARWDGAILAAMGGTGEMVPVAAGDIEAALAAAREQPGRSPGAPFDVAVAHPGVPDTAALDDLASRGVTWVLVTGWLEAAGGLADLADRGPR